jgi:hypothetical protein
MPCTHTYFKSFSNFLGEFSFQPLHALCARFDVIQVDQASTALLLLLLLTVGSR